MCLVHEYGFNEETQFHSAVQHFVKSVNCFHCNALIQKGCKNPLGGLGHFACEMHGCTGPYLKFFLSPSNSLAALSGDITLLLLKKAKRNITRSNVDHGSHGSPRGGQPALQKE